MYQQPPRGAPWVALARFEPWRANAGFYLEIASSGNIQQFFDPLGSEKIYLFICVCVSRPCKLCGADRPTPAHVLSSCPVALKQQRYTYRHNQVLTVLYNVITSTVAKLNRRGKVEAPPSPSIRFVRAGETVPAARRKPPASILESGLNWQLSCDLPDAPPYAFPVHITETEERPDIVLWSDESKQLVLLELTVPNEERVVESRKLKLERYAQLVEACNMRGYKTTVLTVEVGTRGFVATSTHRDLKRLGIWSSVLHSEISSVALRGSYAIYIHRNDAQWNWNAPVHGARIMRA